MKQIDYHKLFAIKNTSNKILPRKSKQNFLLIQSHCFRSVRCPQLQCAITRDGKKHRLSIIIDSTIFFSPIFGVNIFTTMNNNSKRPFAHGASRHRRVLDATYGRYTLVCCSRLFQ